MITKPRATNWRDPVLLSLDGSQFPPTSAANGVRFDFYGDNKPQQMLLDSGRGEGGLAGSGPEQGRPDR